VTHGTVTTATVPNSDLPGLLGLAALRNNRAILDFNSLKLYFLGPGDYNLENSTPPGTDIFQCELAPSGHLVLPCSEFDAGAAGAETSLTLTTQVRPGPIIPVPPPPPTPPQVHKSGSAHL